MMNRAERRRRNELKCIRRLKKYWAKCGLDHIFDRQKHKIVSAPTLNDALKIEHETNGRLFGWLSAVKKGCRYHHRDNWIYYENKHMDNKEKREAKKQMERDVQETLLDRNIYDWENYCGACDNFPGDEFHEPSSFIFHECPQKGKVTADTCWKNFNCPYFWD